ncbi:winged helix-turn-helix domain-containing protein [Streptomyces goshikiensis]|uniref:helix-turn-helix domain-containing protein n=1 Tax=Streptomyces goshikiensis TaxID=1942 RepID=UPI002E12F04A
MATVWRLLNHGWSWQAPARRALERDEHAVELWKKEVWPRVKPRGGVRSMARLRGRSRLLDDSAPSPHLGSARTHPCHPRPRPLPPPDLGRRPVLLQTRREEPPHPPAPHPPPPEGRTQSSSYEDHRADRGPGRYGRPGPRSAGVGTRSVFFSRGTMVKRRVW